MARVEDVQIFLKDPVFIEINVQEAQLFITETCGVKIRTGLFRYPHSVVRLVINPRTPQMHGRLWPDE